MRYVYRLRPSAQTNTRHVRRLRGPGTAHKARKENQATSRQSVAKGRAERPKGIRHFVFLSHAAPQHTPCTMLSPSHGARSSHPARWASGPGTTSPRDGRRRASISSYRTALAWRATLTPKHNMCSAALSSCNLGRWPRRHSGRRPALATQRLAARRRQGHAAISAATLHTYRFTNAASQT